LKKQLNDNSLTPVEEPALPANDEAPMTEATVKVLEAKIVSLEKGAVEWKSEKAKMQKAIGNLKAEIEEYKVQLEEKNRNLANENGTTSSKSWFKSSTPTPNPAVGSSTETLPKPGTESSSAASVQNPHSTTQPAASSLKSWWTRTATPALPSSTPTAVPTGSAAVSAPVNPAPTPVAESNNLEHSKVEDTSRIKLLEQEIERLKKEIHNGLPNLPPKTALDREPSHKGEEKHQLATNDRLNDLEIQMAQIKMERDQKIMELTDLTALSNISTQKLKEMQVTIDQLSESCNAKQALIVTLETKVQDLEKSLSFGNSSIATLNDENSNLKAQIEQERCKLAATVTELTAMITMKNKVESEYDFLLESSKKETVLLQTKLEDTSKMIDQYRSTEEKNKLEMATLTQEIQVLRLAHSSNGEAGEIMKDIQKEHQKSIDTLHDQYSKLESELTTTKTSLRGRILELEGLLQESEIQLREQREKVIKLTDEKRQDQEIWTEKLKREEMFTEEYRVASDKGKEELQSMKSEMLVKHHEVEKLKEMIGQKSGEIIALQDSLGMKTKTEQTMRSQIEEISNRNSLQEGQIKQFLDEKAKLESEVAKKQSLIDSLQAKVSENESAQHTTNSAQGQRITELQVEIQKKNQEIQTLTKKVESSKLELDNLTKQMARNKEASEFLSKSLQDQINQILDQKATSDKKVRNEMEEKFKKEKAELEERFKKEKAELDEKNKKSMIDAELRNTKERVDLEEKFKKEKNKLSQDYDKLKKDTDANRAELQKKMDQAVANKTDELNKSLSRVKSLESELSQLKGEQGKLIDSLNAKISELEKESTSVKEDHTKLNALAENMASLQAKYDLLVQENEVAQANFQRNLKALTEKEDSLKKLKSAKEELQRNEESLKRSIQRLEKERELATSEIQKEREEIVKRITEAETKWNTALETIKQYQDRISALEQERDHLKEDKEATLKKLEETENELSVSGRKAAQMVKDLQKQLQKQRKGEELLERPSSTVNESHLQQENEALIKRAQYFEEELKHADERFKRMNDELDQKSKLVQQYILREHEMALQPEAGPKSGKVRLA
jgi:chromosome segregation ATPase